MRMSTVPPPIFTPRTLAPVRAVPSLVATTSWPGCTILPPRPINIPFSDRLEYANPVTSSYPAMPSNSVPCCDVPSPTTLARTSVADGAPPTHPARHARGNQRTERENSDERDIVNLPYKLDADAQMLRPMTIPRMDGSPGSR